MKCIVSLDPHSRANIPILHHPQNQTGAVGVRGGRRGVHDTCGVDGFTDERARRNGVSMFSDANERVVLVLRVGGKCEKCGVQGRAAGWV